MNNCSYVLPGIYNKEIIYFQKEKEVYWMSDKKHLPRYGIGPIYTVLVIGLTIAGILLSATEHLDFGKIEALQIPFTAIGIIMIFAGIILWYSAVFGSKLDDCIQSNTLATTGVYAYVRNPIYSGILIGCTGALLIANHLWLLSFPFLFWALLTVMMKCTEEKWLKALYGKEYEEYCRRVNRCIPWFTKH